MLLGQESPLYQNGFRRKGQLFFNYFQASFICRLGRLDTQSIRVPEMFFWRFAFANCVSRFFFPLNQFERQSRANRFKLLEDAGISKFEIQFQLETGRLLIALSLE